MRSLGRLRRASANSRPTISVVAPASANIGPAANAPSLGPAPDSSSWPIIFAIWAMAVRGIILGFSRIGRARLRYGATKHSCCWTVRLVAVARRPLQEAATSGGSNRQLPGTVLLHPREESDTRYSKPICAFLLRVGCGEEIEEPVRSPAITAAR